MRVDVSESPEALPSSRGALAPPGTVAPEILSIGSAISQVTTDSGGVSVGPDEAMVGPDVVAAGSGDIPSGSPEMFGERSDVASGTSYYVRPATPADRRNVSGVSAEAAERFGISRCLRPATGVWRIACFESRESPSVLNAIAEFTADPVIFLASALAASRAILGYCDVRGWWDADTDPLRAALSFADPNGAS